MNPARDAGGLFRGDKIHWNPLLMRNKCTLRFPAERGEKRQGSAAICHTGEECPVGVPLDGGDRDVITCGR